MSELLKLFPDIENPNYYQDPDTKEFWFHATGICEHLGFKNVSRTVLQHTDEDERYQDTFNGRSVWYVSEAGCYGLAMAAKSDTAKVFKRWLKHEVLPKLRAEGGYVMPDASPQQLAALQAQIAGLQAANDSLTDAYKHFNETRQNEPNPAKYSQKQQARLAAKYQLQRDAMVAVTRYLTPFVPPSHQDAVMTFVERASRDDVPDNRKLIAALVKCYKMA